MSTSPSTSTSIINAVIEIKDKYLLALVEKALDDKGLALRVQTVTASGSTFYFVGPNDAQMDEAAARTAANNND